MLSKSTDYTEDSTLPPSPVNAGTYSYRYNDIKRGSASSPDVTRAASTSSAHQRAQDVAKRTIINWDRSSLPRRDSDPGSPRYRSRTIPMKRPSRPIHLANEGDTNLSPPEGETDEYLQRMYDSRTWEMYRRITEARKNSNYSYSHPCKDGENNESTSEWENLNHDHLDASSGHEMIFLFDFE